MGLTKKQKEVLDFICQFSSKEGIAPTYAEIQAHFNLKSKGSVHDYVTYLKKGGYLKENSSCARSLTLAEQAEPHLQIPLLGKVAAGKPLDVETQQDHNITIAVPQSMLGKASGFALKVSGNSMIEDFILDGDIIVVRSQLHADNGQTVIALIDGGATVKKFYKKNKSIELHPANSLLQPMIIQNQNFQIQGIVVGLIRQFN